jgi:hypothetical protein
VDVAAGLLVDPHTPGGLREAAAGLLPCLDNLWAMHLPASLALLDQLLAGVFVFDAIRPGSFQTICTILHSTRT